MSLLDQFRDTNYWLVVLNKCRQRIEASERRVSGLKARRERRKRALPLMAFARAAGRGARVNFADYGYHFDQVPQVAITAVGGPGALASLVSVSSTGCDIILDGPAVGVMVLAVQQPQQSSVPGTVR